MYLTINYKQFKFKNKSKVKMTNVQANSNNKNFRKCQSEADEMITTELLTHDKCLVKMFCGTGKSRLMRYGKAFQNNKLCLYVFPSLSLITQFNDDYLQDYPDENLLNVSSEIDSTTDPTKIKDFLKIRKNVNKIICVTYYSYKTLLDNIGTNKINICCYDEAHRAVGEKIQDIIFQNTICEKQVFFTATPKNSNGIIMYDKDDNHTGMCGNLVYDYTYLDGLNDEILNGFKICIDMYMDNTNKTKSLYQTIARTIIETGNTRVLTFHAEVNTSTNTAVKQFVNQTLFRKVFKQVLADEFPEKKKENENCYNKIHMIELHSDITGKERTTILNNLDNSTDNEVYIISSCKTIREGVDTKKANMCVFVDPKQSYVDIIQNIGRIIRKQHKPSTVLIPCMVDKTKYKDCGNDIEKRDAIIREDINKDGNFNGILNVLSALKQEDPDIYDICLHYPDTFSPKEIYTHFNKHGLSMENPVGDGFLEENIDYLLQSDLDYELYQQFHSHEERIMNIAQDNDISIEIHNNSLENPIETYNTNKHTDNHNTNKPTIRLFRSLHEDTEEYIYQPIINTNNNTKTTNRLIPKINRTNNISVNVHTNPDVKVLWNIVGNIDFTKNICSCVIDSEVIKYNPIENWKTYLTKLKEYVHTNHKSPSSTTDKNKETKQLGQWLSNQKQNYNEDISLCKYIMQTPEIHDLWSEFMNDDRYQVCFKPSKNKKSMKLNIPPIKPRETSEQKQERIQSELSILHKRYKVMKSENLNKEFRDNVNDWIKYHEISEENEKSFPEDEIPRNRIIQELDKIKTKRNKKVVDMGCGKGGISQYYKSDNRFTFINYDHISSNESIIECDISKIPLEDDTVEICILSLAMWGSNCETYIREANRILESGGKLYIIEPTKRWLLNDDNENIIEGREAIKLKNVLKSNGFKIIEESIEKFSMFICIK